MSLLAISLLASGESLPISDLQWESGGTVLLRLMVIFGLILLTSFFVAAEFAIIKIRTSTLDNLIEKGNARAGVARQITRELESYLSATQFGITLTSLGLGWVGEPFLARLIVPFFHLVGINSAALVHTISFVIAFTLITYFEILLGELVPKSLAIRKPVLMALWLSPPLRTFYLIFRPFINFLNYSANLVLLHVFRVEPPKESEQALSDEELRHVLLESRQAAAVTELGRKLAVNALDLQRRVVRNIMTPRTDVVFLDLEKPFSDELRKAIVSRHSRFPLCIGSLDESIGLVHTKDLLELMESGKNDLNEISRPIRNVSETMPLEDLLDLFLENQGKMAVAVNEYGGAVGTITLNNVLEELVGSIQDEFDSRQEPLTEFGKDDFDVDGTLPLHDLTEQSGMKFEPSSASTIGGYVTELLRHLPARGESIRIGDFTATVAETDGRRILVLNFKKHDSPAD